MGSDAGFMVCVSEGPADNHSQIVARAIGGRRSAPLGTPCHQEEMIHPVEGLGSARYLIGRRRAALTRGEASIPARAQSSSCET